jgi:hypothetical protein
MIKRYFTRINFGLFIFLLISSFAYSQSEKGLIIGKAGYFEMPGLNVLVYNNTFLRDIRAELRLFSMETGWQQTENCV